MTHALTTRRSAGIPPLAWVATVRAGPVVDLVAGELVETHDGSFVAGAWDGPYDELGLLDATAMMGSGGCVSDDAVTFCSSTHLLDLLYSVRVDDAVVASNSLPLLLACTGDGPDVRYRRYRFDLVELWRAGVAGSPAQLPTRSGRQVLVHGHVNLIVERDVSVRATEKRLPPMPEDFTAYRRLLAGTVDRLIDNATDGLRNRPLRPLVTLSSGYDSAAGAVLGVEAGIEDAVTIVPGPGHADSGEAIARRLGLHLSVLDEERWRQMLPPPEIEFAASVSGPSHLPLAALEDDGRASVVLVGSLGDTLWSADGSQFGDLPMSQPRGVIFPTRSMHDFGLRAGIVFLHVPLIGACHAHRIAAISTSPEMAPWRTGTDYDRPIPRRILEEAGVPRDAFAKRKTGGASMQQGHALGSTASADFTAFWRAACRGQRRARRIWWWVEVRVLVPLAWRTLSILVRLHASERVRRPLRAWIYHRALPAAYRFHWSVTRLGERFAPSLPPDGRTAP